MVSVEGGQVTQCFGVSGDNPGSVRRTIFKTPRRGSAPLLLAGKRVL